MCTRKSSERYLRCRQAVYQRANPVTGSSSQVAPYESVLAPYESKVALYDSIQTPANRSQVDRQPVKHGKAAPPPHIDPFAASKFLYL